MKRVNGVTVNFPLLGARFLLFKVVMFIILCVYSPRQKSMHMLLQSSTHVSVVNIAYSLGSLLYHNVMKASVELFVFIITYNVGRGPFGTSSKLSNAKAPGQRVTSRVVDATPGIEINEKGFNKGQLLYQINPQYMAREGQQAKAEEAEESWGIPYI